MQEEPGVIIPRLPIGRGMITFWIGLAGRSVFIRIPNNEMFFFDDEYRNVAEVGKMGVHASLVDDGLSLAAIHCIPGLEYLMT